MHYDYPLISLYKINTPTKKKKLSEMTFKIRLGPARPAVEPHVFTNSCQKNDTFGSKQYITSLKKK